MKKHLVTLFLLFCFFISAAYARELGITAKRDLLNVLWLNPGAQLPADVKITPQAELGKNVNFLLDTLDKKYIFLVEKYSERYALLKKLAAKGITTKQAYSLADIMAQDYFDGFGKMSNQTELRFPDDHSTHLDYQIGWYFFVGNFTDNKGTPYGVLCMLFRRALFPPPIAKQLGLSDIENQIVDVQFGVTLGDKKIHVRGRNAVIDGASGLVKFTTSPFIAAAGKNQFKSLNKDMLFPLEITFKDSEIPLSVNLLLSDTKPILLQGVKGKAPAMFGLGSGYYSIPNINASGTISYQGVSREVTGKMWMDNQWMAGVVPPGYGDALWIRALTNIIYAWKGIAPEGWAWDWTEVQFDDNTEVTFSAMHSPNTKDLQNHGEKSPGKITRVITAGKYNPSHGKPTDITGEVTLTDWVKSPVSGAWYPCGWEVFIPEQNLHFKMTPLVKDQFMYFGNAAEYKEGAVLVEGTKGGRPIHGAGFGEAVGYEGDEFYVKTKLNVLGIENSDQNRALVKNHPPGFWLILQSILFFALPLLLIIGGVIYLISRKKLQ